MKKTTFHGAILVIWIASVTIAAPPAWAQRSGGTGFGKKLRTHVEQDVLRKLRPFFPQAKTTIDEKGTLIILTCARNISPLVCFGKSSLKLRSNFIPRVCWRKLVLR